MKRKRDSISFDAPKEVDDPEIQRRGPSFADLPCPITTNILLRLPIKFVVICRCVCKSWDTIISDPKFAKLHFKHAPDDVMIRTDNPNRVSRALHLLDFEPNNYMNNEHLKLQVRFKLPLRDAKKDLDKMLETKNGRKSPYIPCKPRDDKFAVVNSCNGFLCLCDPKDRNPLVVCNPVTGEFMRIPETKKAVRLRETFDCGFGFDKKTNEYKVIRVYNQYVQQPTNSRERLYEDRVAEVHTVGTRTWRNVGGDGNVPSGLTFPTNLSGALHWLYLSSFVMRASIVSFDFETERFQSFPPPRGVDKHVMSSDSIENMSMGELRGLLYICLASTSNPVILWVMKEYGVGDSWTKLFSIDEYYDGDRWPHGLYRPIKLFNKGDGILMYQSRNLLIYYDRKKHKSKFFSLFGTQLKFEAIAHIPSLISLKDAVKGDNVEILNVNSRCATFKLREENDVLSLEKEIKALIRLCSSSSSDDEELSS